MSQIKTIYGNNIAPPVELEDYATTEYVNTQINNIKNAVLDVLTLKLTISRQDGGGSTPNRFTITNHSGTWSSGQNASIIVDRDSINDEWDNTAAIEISFDKDKTIHLYANTYTWQHKEPYMRVGFSSGTTKEYTEEIEYKLEYAMS